MIVEGFIVKPCWFCKSDKIVWVGLNRFGMYTIRCMDCDTELSTYDKYKLIDKWNEKYDRAYNL